MQAGFLPWGSLLPLGVAALLCLGGSSGSSSHTLRYLIAMWGPDHGLHQLFALGYLDDQLLMRYDSNTRTTLPGVPWMRKVEEKNPDYWEWQSWAAEHLRRKFTEDVEKLQKHSNQTGAFYTFQRIVLCELTADGQKGALMHYYGYDGRDLLRFELETLTWRAAGALAQVLKGGWDADLTTSQHLKAYLEGPCIAKLQQFLGYGKESLLRTELPVVKVARKASNGSLETHVCRAHGFYPKEVAIGWRKDGEVWEEDTVHGGVTPNSDGTYHTWLSIRMDPKDRGRYQCCVEHAGLQESLKVAWKESASAWPLVGSISGAAALLLVAGTLLLLLRKRMKQWGVSTAASNQSGPQGFTSLPKSEDFSLLSFPASDQAAQATKDPPPSS